MSKLNNEEKAILYNDMLTKYRKLEKEISEIKLKNFEISDDDQKKINVIKQQLNKIYTDVQKLYI